jgi:hypothetical protein
MGCEGILLAGGIIGGGLLLFAMLLNLFGMDH